MIRRMILGLGCRRRIDVKFFKISRNGEVFILCDILVISFEKEFEFFILYSLLFCVIKMFSVL